MTNREFAAALNAQVDILGTCASALYDCDMNEMADELGELNDALAETVIALIEDTFDGAELVQQLKTAARKLTVYNFFMSDVGYSAFSDIFNTVTQKMLDLAKSAEESGF